MVVIASAVRTPLGSFQGALSPLKASHLGAAAVREAVRRAGIGPDQVELVLLGNVLPAGMGQAPARQAAIYAGLAPSTPSVTINKMCGSGLEAIIQGARAVALGDAQVVVVGGMESMSNAPYLLPGARAGLRMGHAQLIDSMIHDGLWDAYYDQHMGSCAELCARHYAFSREAQDNFAERSYRRAQAALANGWLAAEVVPVEVPGRRGAVTVSTDEEPGRVDFAKLPTLKPVFEPDGSITAGNASTISDGAAAVVITREALALANGWPVLARIAGYSVHAHDPQWFTTAPVFAMRKLLQRRGWSPADVDLFEINEAFAVVTMAAMAELELPAEKVNVHGGAVSLGHPIGASGARLVVTLLHALRRLGKVRGMVSICIGGGEALALGLERVS
ncbi:MAG: thiolase family protein [Truepera sp.]|nr:thiolase family protein [Truepera sp.]